MTTRVAVLRAIGLLAGLALAMSPRAWAQPPNDSGRLLVLSNLYGEGGYNTAAHACSGRFPDGAARWTASLSAWKTRNAALLADIRDLDAQLSAAVRTAPEAAGLTQMELLSLRTMGTVWILGGLAEARDPQARELCDKLLGRLENDDAQSRAAVDQARAMARELLAKGAGRP